MLRSVHAGTLHKCKDLLCGVPAAPIASLNTRCGGSPVLSHAPAVLFERPMTSATNSVASRTVAPDTAVHGQRSHPGGMTAAATELSLDDGRKRIEQEDHLINHRVSWLIGSQSFLMLSFVLLRNTPAIVPGGRRGDADAHLPRAERAARLCDSGGRHLDLTVLGNGCIRGELVAPLVVAGVTFPWWLLHTVVTHRGMVGYDACIQNEISERR